MKTKYYLILLLIYIIEVQQVLGGLLSKGRFKRSFLESDKLGRGGRKCHDFCAMIPELCRNGGTCVTDESTCIGKCVCAPGWTGQWCREPYLIPDYREDLVKENEVTTASELNDIDKHIRPSLNRAHAIKSTRLVNEFRNGVDGILKELRGNFFTLKPIISSAIVPSKRAVVDSSESNEPEDDRTLRKRCEKTCVKGDCYKINGIYQCKPRVNATDTSIPKVCDPGFECIHGVCDMEALKTNSYKCICENNYVGQFCSLKCPYDCGEFGRCDIHVANNTYKCFCQWNYTGLNCSELVPEDPEIPFIPDEVIFHWYVVGVSVAMVFVIISGLFIVAYFMWRRRLVFMLKIVHYFQHYEEDDGKEFDAFVSYKSCPRDDQFVLHQLFPKLEGEYNFKLCMHFRDFLPGEAIANNIVSAIERSRRTIMILSPEYVQSEWCRMEYQKAQHEMLKLKHKIIPIVLADLTEVKNIDTNLKSILNSVTYLEWPGNENSKKSDKFWKKLQLSLPKKSSQQSLQTTDSISSESCKSPVPESDLTSSDVLVPTSSVSSSSISSSLDIRSGTESPTPSSEVTDSNSPRFQKNKRKDFKHFMDKLVRTKLFSRQDSNSSQAALVDDDTMASRSSCGSVSESTLSESTDSICSTPDTGHSYLNEINEDIESNSFMHSMYSDSDMRIGKGHSLDRLNTTRYFDRHRKVSERASERIRPSKRFKENLVGSECEKDHCMDVQCSNCIEIHDSNYNSDRNSQEFLNKGFEGDTNDNIECEYCLYERNRSDNNRIRISALDGSDQLRIQRLGRETAPCHYCNHVFSRCESYRGSVKQHKDAQNFEIMKQKQKRVASLPRNFKRKHLQRQDGTFITRDLSAGTHIKDNKPPENNSFIDVFENI